MAKDSSFDVVSEVNMQEVDNAFQQTSRELAQRYDLKDSGATIELSKADKLFTLNAPADFVARQIIDVLSGKLIKRGVDVKAVKWDDPQAASGAPSVSSAISSRESTRRLPRRSTKTSRTRSSRSRSPLRPINFASRAPRRMPSSRSSAFCAIRTMVSRFSSPTIVRIM